MDVQYVIALGAVLLTVFILLKKKFNSHPPMPPFAKPYGVVDARGVLWQRGCQCLFAQPSGASVYDLIQLAIKAYGSHEEHKPKHFSLFCFPATARGQHAGSTRAARGQHAAASGSTR